MNVQEWLLDELYCPQSGEKLELDGEYLRSKTQVYPAFKGIPWLFAEPEFSWAEWGTKIAAFLEHERADLKYLQQQLERCSSPLSKKRLLAQHQGRHKNLQLMEKTLADFKRVEHVHAMASQQQIQSYFELFFRDWVWGEEEVSTYVDFVLDNLPKTEAKVLILGSGAGGLSYQLAKKRTDSNFVSLEHNPLLAALAEHIQVGKSLKLHEVVEYADVLEHSSVKHEIKQEKLDSNNHQSILTAFPNLPFKAASFDVVIAPWFLDILDQPFDDALDVALAQLKDDGSFLYFGPANVHKKNSVLQLGNEEIAERFSARFSGVNSQVKSMFYLDSPYQAQRRQENVLFLSATGVEKRPELISSVKDNKTVHVSGDIEKYKMKIAMHLNVLKFLDRDMPLDELAKLLMTHFGLSAEEARPYAWALYCQIERDASSTRF